MAAGVDAVGVRSTSRGANQAGALGIAGGIDDAPESLNFEGVGANHLPRAYIFNEVLCRRGAHRQVIGLAPADHALIRDQFDEKPIASPEMRGAGLPPHKF